MTTDKNEIKRLNRNFSFGCVGLTFVPAILLYFGLGLPWAMMWLTIMSILVFVAYILTQSMNLDLDVKLDVLTDELKKKDGKVK